MIKGYNKRFMAEDFLDIRYISNVDGCTAIRPEL